MPKNQPAGEIIVPFGALPLAHELAVAKTLINTGFNVEFIPASTHVTPDIKYNNFVWEIKSPLGKSSRTIENNLRKALHQSCNIILDLRRSPLPDQQIFAYIQHHISTFRGLKRMLIIAKDNNIYNFSPKTTCFSRVHLIK